MYNKEKRQEYLRKWRSENKPKTKAHNQKWRSDNKEKEQERHRQYYAEHLEKERARTRKKNITHKERIRQWGKANPKTKREQTRKWESKNPGKLTEYSSNRRARELKAAGQYTAKEWRDLRADYGKRCAYCNKKTTLTADHIVPLTKGGTNDISNIVPSCKSCNSSKNNTPLLMWLYKKLLVVN